jgi:hypothetical protein
MNPCLKINAADQTPGVGLQHRLDEKDSGPIKANVFLPYFTVNVKSPLVR